MNRIAFVVPLLAFVSCISAGTAEEFQWSLDCPKTVDKGAEFRFLVKAVRPGGPEVLNVKYRYQIQWPAGSGNPLRYSGWSSVAEKTHARMVPGTATMVVTCLNREGLDVKVLETTFEVK